jgi:4-hydroxybenzoate polyprenyltransferase
VFGFKEQEQNITPNPPRVQSRAPLWYLARRLLLISRPALWINTLGSAVVALWLSGRLWVNDPWWWCALVWLSLPFNLLIYGINDLCDQNEDAHNPRKGGWGGARLEPSENAWLLWAIVLCNAPFVLLLSSKAGVGLGLILAITLFVAYSLPPLRFKARPFWDSLSNVAYALPLLWVPALFGTAPNYLALGGLMCWSVGKHAFDAVQDSEMDRSSGIQTIATVLGIRGTSLWSGTWFFATALILSFLHPLVGLAVLLISGTLCYQLWKTPTLERASKLYLASVISPWLIGMVAGVLLVAHLVKG